MKKRLEKKSNGKKRLEKKSNGKERLEKKSAGKEATTTSILKHLSTAAAASGTPGAKTRLPCDSIHGGWQGPLCGSILGGLTADLEQRFQILKRLLENGVLMATTNL